VCVIRTAIYPTQKASLAHRLANYFSFTISSATLGSVLLDPPDYLLVESPPLFLGFSGIWLSWLKRSRLIFNVSDVWPDSAVRVGVLRRESVSYRLSAWLEGYCYRHAWLVTGQTKGIVTDIGTRFPECPTYYLPSGVDRTAFSPDRRSGTARTVLHDNGKCVALYAGLHGLAQGLDQLLDASQMLRDEGELQMVLMGDGPVKRRLAARAKAENLTNMRFLEPRPAADIPPLLASADMLLVLLRGGFPDAVPSKLYEAMASGRPVVVVSDGEAAELVREHRAGLAVEPGDVKGLADAIRRLRHDPELRRELGENGRRAAERCFDRARIVEEFIDYLERNLSRA
jgi:glycosyltransferase involved in cell wall biosynthesis